jgi:hypothetical protein
MPQLHPFAPIRGLALAREGKVFALGAGDREGIAPVPVMRPPFQVPPAGLYPMASRDGVQLLTLR